MRKLLALVVVLAATASAQSVQNARNLERAGQLDKARDEYFGVLARVPTDMMAYNGFRRLCLETETYDSLLALSTRLAQAHPGRFEYQQGRIDGLFGTKQHREALKQTRAGVDAQPGFVMHFVDVLEHWREFGEATRFLREARQASGDSALLAGRMMQLYEQDRKFVQAAGEVVRIVNRQPGSLEGFLGKLSLYAGKAKLRPMLAEVARIQDPRARARAEAEVYLARGDWKKALGAVEPVFGKDGMYGFAHEAEARDAFDVALKVYRDQDLFADQARVLRKMGRENEALAVLAKDRSPEAKFELAELYRMEQGRLRSAVESYSEVLARRPQHEPSVYGIASAYFGLGEVKKAREALLRSGSRSDRVLLLLAEAALYSGEMDSVGSYVSELAARFPHSALLNDGLELALVATAGERAEPLGAAMLSLRRGELEDAEKRCRKLLAGTDAVAEMAHFLLSDVLRQDGRGREAMELLDEYGRRFAGSPRLAKALLEQAEIAQADLGDENKQRELLERLVVELPGSSYAPIARSLLAEANLPVDPDDIR